MYVLNNDVTYFHTLGVEDIPKWMKAFIDNKIIKANILKIHAYDSIMYGYNSVKFIDFMHAGNILTDFTDLYFTK